ncbi:MAG: outer membrane lipoprotein carrier protein LolA [Wenzhouxiangella sp.]
MKPEMTTRRWCHCTVFSLALLASLAWAEPVVEQETERPDARAQLDAFSQGLETIRARFSQMTLDPDGLVIDSAEGAMVFQAPDRFRWSYEEPFPMEIVADGEQLWHYDEALDQVTVREQPAAGESPLMVLTQPELLDRFYRIEESGRREVLRFRPLSDEVEFEFATLEFYQGEPVMLELLDRFQQITRLELIDLERNPELEADLFEFEVPDGADVLQGFEP